MNRKQANSLWGDEVGGVPKARIRTIPTDFPVLGLTKLLAHPQSRDCVAHAPTQKTDPYPFTA